MALVEKSFLPLNALNGVRALVSSCAGPMQPSFSVSSHIPHNSIPATGNLSTTSLSLPSLKDVLFNVGLAQRQQSTLPAYTPVNRSSNAVVPIASQEVEVDFSAAIGALSIVDHEENQPRSRLPQRTKAKASKRGRRDAPYSLGFESAFDPHTYGEDLEIHSHYQDMPVVGDPPQQTRFADRVAVTQATRARRRATTRETYDPELDLKIIRYIDLGDLWDLNVVQTGRYDRKGTAIYRCLNPDTKAPGMCSYLAAKQTVKRHVHTVHLELRPYVCVFRDSVTGEPCNAAFSQKSAFKIHRQSVHTHEQKHGCPVCGLMFSDPSKRNKHQGFKHPEVETKKRTKNPYAALFDSEIHDANAPEDEGTSTSPDNPIEVS